MIRNAFAPAQPRCAGLPARSLPVIALLLGCLAMAGCGGGGLFNRSGSASAVAAQPPLPQDPLAAFAAQAAPGTASRITLSDGRAVDVRLLRRYAAASGRECREVQIGSGSTQRSQVVCNTEETGWAVSRPLLRGGGTVRP